MITLEDITKDYVVGEQTINVLKGVSLKINEGEFVSIMGPSGSGKSTLMNIIGMLDNSTSGKYVIDGEQVNDLSDNDQCEIRGKKIGFVFQSYNLIPRLNILEQVALPLAYQGISKKERHERAKQALTKLGLGDRVTSQPKELSGGQQQRVAIARAIVINPAIILADEPTGALDTKTSNEVMDIFTGLHNEGKTIIMITHEPEISEYAKRKIMIKDGNILTN